MNELDPLKIPAFMRKKSSGKRVKKRESADYLRPEKKRAKPVRRAPKPAPLPTFSAPEPEVVTEAPRPKADLMPVGVVTQYIEKIDVVIIKLGGNVLSGDRLILPGEARSFKHKVTSMQFNREPVNKASRGQEVGIKVSKKVKVGEMVYLLG